MTVHKKLNDARKEFRALELKKTGKNAFAGYSYFELGDFIDQALEMTEKHGLCGVVSFPDDAVLTLTDVEDGSAIVIRSPMGSAALKGCHEVQNIGAVETYQRRYLWQAAFEIVERDALDATAGKAEPEQRRAPVKPDANAQMMPDDEYNRLTGKMKLAGVAEAALLDAYKVSDLRLITQSQYADAIKRLDIDIAEKSKSKAPAGFGETADVDFAN